MKILMSPNAAGEMHQYRGILERGHECYFLNGSTDPICLTPQGSLSGVRAFLPSRRVPDYFLEAIGKVNPDWIWIDYCSGSISVMNMVIPRIRHEWGGRHKIVTFDGDSTECCGNDHKHKIEPFVHMADLNFFVDEDMVNYCAERGKHNCRWIRQPCVNEHHFKIGGMRKHYDAVFVGSAYNCLNPDGTGTIPRTQMLHYLHVNEPNLKLCYAGDPKYEIFERRFWGGSTRIEGDDPDSWFINCNLLYNQSKVVLCNDASTARKFSSVRLGNALLSGSMVLTRYNQGYEELFGNHEHLVWFNSVEECRELLKYYLSHETERERIASTGSRWAISEGFTREGFMNTVLDAIESI